MRETRYQNLKSVFARYAYLKGCTLEEAGQLVGRSGTWVRQQLIDAGQKRRQQNTSVAIT